MARSLFIVRRFALHRNNFLCFFSFFLCLIITTGIFDPANKCVATVLSCKFCLIITTGNFDPANKRVATVTCIRCIICCCCLVVSKLGGALCGSAIACSTMVCSSSIVASAIFCLTDNARPQRQVCGARYSYLNTGRLVGNWMNVLAHVSHCQKNRGCPGNICEQYVYHMVYMLACVGGGSQKLWLLAPA